VKFKLQTEVAGYWLPVPREFLAKIPTNVDVLLWLHLNFPVTSFRFVVERKPAS